MMAISQAMQDQILSWFDFILPESLFVRSVSGISVRTTRS